MIYIDEPLNDFIEKWKLMIIDYNCPKCGESFPKNIPVYLKDSAGLVSKIHACGSGYSGITLTPRTENARMFWDKVFGD